MRMVGFYNYTVIATYIGFLSGVLGILFSAADNRFGAIICLIVCGVIDSVDGTIARTKIDRTISEKRFGIEIDSLSDLTTFGLLPAAIAYSYGKDYLTTIIASVFALCALIRLAYFDVIAEEKLIGGEKNDSYKGLPVTSGAWLLPLVCGISALVSGSVSIDLIRTVLLMLAVMFIAPFRLKKPGKKYLFIGIFFSFILLGILLYEGINGML